MPKSLSEAVAMDKLDHIRKPSKHKCSASTCNLKMGTVCPIFLSTIAKFYAGLMDLNIMPYLFGLSNDH